MPERIQLRRAKGWRKPAGAVVVARPSKWGNPYVVVSNELVAHDDGRDWWLPNGDARKFAVNSYREDLLAGRFLLDVGKWSWGVDDVRRELAGHDLCCWCAFDVACHADVLLELANRSDT